MIKIICPSYSPKKGIHIVDVHRISQLGYSTLYRIYKMKQPANEFCKPLDHTHQAISFFKKMTKYPLKQLKIYQKEAKHKVEVAVILNLFLK